MMEEYYTVEGLEDVLVLKGVSDDNNYLTFDNFGSYLRDVCYKLSDEDVEAWKANNSEGWDIQASEVNSETLKRFGLFHQDSMINFDDQFFAVEKKGDKIEEYNVTIDYDVYFNNVLTTAILKNSFFTFGGLKPIGISKKNIIEEHGRPATFWYTVSKGNEKTTFKCINEIQWITEDDVGDVEFWIDEPQIKNGGWLCDKKRGKECALLYGFFGEIIKYPFVNFIEKFGVTVPDRVEGDIDFEGDTTKPVETIFDSLKEEQEKGGSGVIKGDIDFEARVHGALDKAKVSGFVSKDDIQDPANTFADERKFPVEEFQPRILPDLELQYSDNGELTEQGDPIVVFNNVLMNGQYVNRTARELLDAQDLMRFYESMFGKICNTVKEVYDLEDRPEIEEVIKLIHDNAMNDASHIFDLKKQVKSYESIEAEQTKQYAEQSQRLLDVSAELKQTKEQLESVANKANEIIQNLSLRYQKLSVIYTDTITAPAPNKEANNV